MAELDPNTLFVRNIPYKATAEELNQLFIKYGAVKSVRILMERYRGEQVSKGVGFVEYESTDSIQNALNEANKDSVQIGGRIIRIQQAKKRIERKRDTAFVGGIPEGTTVDDLKQLFAKYNPVDAKIISAIHPPQRGFAFIKFASTADQEKAVTENRTIKVGNSQEDSKVSFARRDFDAPPRRRFRRRFTRGGTGGRRAPRGNRENNNAPQQSQQPQQH